MVETTVNNPIRRGGGLQPAVGVGKALAGKGAGPHDPYAPEAMASAGDGPGPSDWPGAPGSHAPTQMPLMPGVVPTSMAGSHPGVPPPSPYYPQHPGPSPAWSPSAHGDIMMHGGAMTTPGAPGMYRMAAPPQAGMMMSHLRLA